MIYKRLLAGGIIADITYVMATNAYANTVLPSSGIPWELTNAVQILAAVCGLIICLSRALKTIAKAYFIKKKADLLKKNTEKRHAERPPSDGK